MSILWYFLFPVLFLNYNIKKCSKREQIVRYLIGFAYAFLVFYVGNMDRSISFAAANLKWVALFQLIFSSAGTLKKRSLKEGKDIAINKFNALFLIILVGSIIYSSIPYINGGTKNLYTMTNVKESDKQSPKIDTENIIIISPETAYYEMQTLIGSLPNPSLYKIGQVTLTKTEKGAYYVAPIDIEGNLKAFLNKELPGVVYVSAERLEDAKIIKVPYKYGESLVLNHNIYRKLREYAPDKILLNANVELDDNLNPYYVGTYGHYKYGRNGIIVDGVLLYDTKNGKVENFSKDKVPAWVDQVYTSQVAETYNDYFGRYQNGLINSKIGQKGVHIPTRWSSGVNLKGLEVESNQVVGVVGNNGSFYFFTDHTNTSSTSTTMTGYTLMNTRNGEMTYYKTPGFLNGEGAMNSVEKLLGANKSNWTTSQPILYNLYGIDTWIIPIVNKTDGSFVKIGLVTAQSKYSVLADNKVDLLEAFKKAIVDGTINQNSDTKVKNDAQLKKVQKEGKILRINQVVEDGKTVFYLKIDSEPNNIFMVDKNINTDVVLARDGDSIKLEYVSIDDQKVIPVTGFTLKLQ
jgi:hypothetical protein